MGKPTLHLLAAAAVIAAVIPGAARARTYDAATDFSNSQNPNGVWSYLSGGTLMTGNGNCGLPGFSCVTNGGSYPNAATIGKNTTANTIGSGTITIRANSLLIDPQATANTMVRFTAPEAGTYTITGSFFGDDTIGNDHPVYIALSGYGGIFSGAIANSASSDPFHLTETLAQGQTLDFGVGQGTVRTASDYLATGLSVTISDGTRNAVPEPTSLALLGAAMLGLGVARRKTRLGG